jgi:tRNA pseudouridine32 synthase/23S rRNA pseudouridine746 synthase
VEAIARDLMATLAQDPAHGQEGKMYGVLLAQSPRGDRVILRAFSGLLNGVATVPGWVPPMPGRSQVALQEQHTLATLEAIKTELITLQALPVRPQLAAQQQHYAQRLADLAVHHRQRRRDRQHQRQAAAPAPEGDRTALLAALDRQSQRDGLERRRLKQERDGAIAPLQQLVQDADQRIQALKRQRKTLSRQLQAQMHAAYRLTNFAGDSLTLQALEQQALHGGGLPTGTGDCAAPKLLHAAAVQGVRPLALAEFWWGPTQGDKVPGQFYGACRDRCQPIMGFLLSGLSDPWPALPLGDAPDLNATGQAVPSAPRSPHGPVPLLPLPILYEDADLLAVDKPPGLLSVPGRGSAQQDSVLSRLRCQHPAGDRLQPVHRLDQDTSGVLLLAKTAAAHRHLQAQFQNRQVQKRYVALLSQAPPQPQGTVTLPLWANPATRPRQIVCDRQGKPSCTHYRVLALGPDADPGAGQNRTGSSPVRVEFRPVTGRTHQLRVHAAHPQGLHAPILGDRLYGSSAPVVDLPSRLYLHAAEVQVQGWESHGTISITSPCPF